MGYEPQKSNLDQENKQGRATASHQLTQHIRLAEERYIREEVRFCLQASDQKPG